jgi:ribonuclease HI
MAIKKKKYYVVWKGRQTGIFNTWDETAAQVNGFTGAEYKAFESRAEAESAFRGEYKAYRRKSTPRPLAVPGTAQLARSRLKSSPVQPDHPIPDSYCVDAASSGNPGRLEYRGVYTATRKEIFHQGPFQHGTNNVGEFLAIVHALAMFKEKGIPQPLYTDSVNAMKWVKAKKCKTKLARTEQNVPLFDLIARAESWLASNTYETKILKWDTRSWGEIPADFGRK